MHIVKIKDDNAGSTNVPVEGQAALRLARHLFFLSGAVVETLADTGPIRHAGPAPRHPVRIW